jgi:polyhydroxybutyrate depolymerase
MSIESRIGPVVIVLLVAACGATDESTSREPSSAPSETARPTGGELPSVPGASTPAPPAEAAPPGPPCAGKATLKGNLDWTIASGGRSRVVHVHLPPGYDAAKASPVVLDFHGLSMNAAGEDLLARMNAKADKAGFVAVHAEGIGAQQSWNAGTCCGEAASSNVNDVAFVGLVLDELESKLCVDARRIFSTGMSNGGALSYRLACELSGRIAAIAPVAHVLTIPAASCKPTRPISVLAFNGSEDTFVPYGGNGLYPGVVTTVSGWAARNGCQATPQQTSKKGVVTCVTYAGCNAGTEVSHCTVQGGGHQWPGGTPVPGLGTSTNDIVATDAMWDFFVKHPMPE